MTCDQDGNRTLIRGTVEYLTGTATADEVIGADALELSFDRVTWYPAEWVGATGTTQAWRILVGTTVPLPTASVSSITLRITDSPEIPLINAGTLRIQG